MNQANTVIEILQKLATMLAPAYKIAWAAAMEQVHIWAIEDIFLVVFEIAVIITIAVVLRGWWNRIHEEIDGRYYRGDDSDSWSFCCFGGCVISVILTVVIFAQIGYVITALADPTWATMHLLLHIAG